MLIDGSDYVSAVVHKDLSLTSGLAIMESVAGMVKNLREIQPAPMRMGIPSVSFTADSSCRRYDE